MTEQEKINTVAKELEEIKRHRKPASQEDDLITVVSQSYKDEKGKLDMVKGEEAKVDHSIEAQIKASLDNIQVENGERLDDEDKERE